MTTKWDNKIEVEQYSVKAVQERAAPDVKYEYLRVETANTVEKSLTEIVQDLAKQIKEVQKKKSSGPQFRAASPKM